MYHQSARLAPKLKSISLNPISLCFSTRSLSTVTGNKSLAELARQIDADWARKVVSLKCPSTAEGGVCDVHLVGTTHLNTDSCNLVWAVINLLKPQVVFLELCRYRAGFINTPEINGANEFHVAYKEAIKYGANVILGDRSTHITDQRLRELRTESISGPRVDAQDDVVVDVDYDEETYLKSPAYVEVLIHERDKYMASELLKVTMEHNSVVAVVGEDHLVGMRKQLEQSIQVNGQ